MHPDCQRVLLIKEKFWFRDTPPQWKFPGGLVDRDEPLDKAAIREVFEETGIQTSFEGILGMREIPTGFRHQTADLYFPCLLKVSDISKTEIAMQEQELQACEWIEMKDLKDVQFYVSANQIIHSCILDHVNEDGQLQV